MSIGTNSPAAGSFTVAALRARERADVGAFRPRFGVGVLAAVAPSPPEKGRSGMTTRLKSAGKRCSHSR